MKYLVIEIAAFQAPRLEEELAAFELEGLEVLNPQDSMYFQSHWDEDEAPEAKGGDRAVLKIYGDRDELDRLVESYRKIIFNYSFEDVVEKDWNELWARQFSGIKLGDFFIRPPWLEARGELIDLIIEPGMAFGTGSHETTMLCLGALKDYIKPGDLVYDVGTGSGILALAAKTLGASYVKGIEIDDRALDNARHNRELNKLEVEFSQGDLLQGLTEKADLIVANILPNILKDMKEDAHILLEEDGQLILSGILDIRVDELLDFYGDYFKLLELREMDQWQVLILEKR